MSEAPKDPQRTYNDASVLKAIKDYGDEMMANEVYPTKDKYRDGRTYKELATMTKEQWDSFLVARGAPDAEKPLTPAEMLDRFAPMITGVKGNIESLKGEERPKDLRAQFAVYMNAKRQSEEFIGERLPGYRPANKQTTHSDIEGLRKSRDPLDQKNAAEISRILEEMSGRRDELYEQIFQEVRDRKRPGFTHDIQALFEIIDDRVDADFVKHVNRQAPGGKMPEIRKPSDWERAIEQCDAQRGAGTWERPKELLARTARKPAAEKVPLPPPPPGSKNRGKG